MLGFDILVIDDEEEIRDLVAIYLGNEGFTVTEADSAEAALELLERRSFHLAIIDIMMPGMDGLSLCRAIRSSSNIPIIFLSAKSEDIDKILGLSTGADDYMVKPFNPLELSARVKSQIRRFVYLNSGPAPAADKQSDPDVIELNGLSIKVKEHSITKYGTEIYLTPTEFGILKLLAENRGIVFSSEQIFRHVWKDDYYASNNTVMVHIRKIREKIEDDPGNPRYVKTVWGVGYKIDR